MIASKVMVSPTIQFRFRGSAGLPSTKSPVASGTPSVFEPCRESWVLTQSKAHNCFLQLSRIHLNFGALTQSKAPAQFFL